ncbi:MAG: HAD-IA family hydrolase [Candidatus Xiphinematobacter sp.]|nr:MAG: HAD-IA family hydrolase [Candidatus Xiphinematobacter sp.]
MKQFTRLVHRGICHRWPRRSSDVRIPSSPKLLVFDFDGTIADTFQASLCIFNEMAAEFGYRPILSGEVEIAREMSARQLMKYLGISTVHLPKISLRGFQLLYSRIENILPIRGMPELLHELGDRGIPMGILTSNSGENVRAFLHRNRLEIFSFTHSSSHLFGKGHEIKTILRRNQLSAQEIIFVGDETRDVEAAQQAKVPIIAVGWGYSSYRVLKASNPQATIECPRRLLEFLPPHRGFLSP